MVWSFPNIFLVLLVRSRKLALNRMKHLHLVVVLGAFYLVEQAHKGYLACLCVHTSICMYVHLSICLYIHLFICMSICMFVVTFVQPYVPLYVPWHFWRFIHVLVRDQCVCKVNCSYIQQLSVDLSIGPIS